MANETSVPSKSILRSKTLWVQVLTVVMALVPAVQQWIKANPVEFLSVLAAVNTLVRFVTSGVVTIFPEDDGASGNGSATGTGVSGGSAAGRDAGAGFGNVRGSGFPWLVGPACALLLASCMVGVDEAGNYSVRPDPNSIDAVLKYAIRQEPDAKGATVEWEYYDPKTGEVIPREDYAAWGIKP